MAWLVAALILGAAVLTAPLQLRGQQLPDTLKTDTVPKPAVPVDEAEPDEVTVRADTVSADTVFYRLPSLDAPGPAGWAVAAWSWDHGEILASGAATLAQLLAGVPGVIPLLAGDFGTPVAATAFGLGGGGIRVFRDGFEVIPLEGGIPDLARIGLVGITAVRVERFPGALIVRLEGLQHQDGRPYSLFEAGAGDLNTNLLRGLFADPSAVGGSVAVGLERADSRGARGNETGDVTGTLLRYQLHRGDNAGLAVELRSMGSKTQAAQYASGVTRSEWTVRGRARLLEGLNAEAYWGRSTHSVSDARPRFEGEGGSRSQLGVRAAVDRSGIFAEGAYRRFGGDGLPSGRLDLRVGADLPAVGGVSADLDRGFWPGVTTGSWRVSGWTRPVLGLSLFGSRESGSTGGRVSPVRTLEELAGADGGDGSPPAEPEVPAFHVTERTATRAGAMWGWRGFTVSAAVLEVEADSLLPFGLEPDRGTPPLAGGTRSGWEAWGRIPMPMSGLALQGFLQQWDEDWSYMPRRIFQGAFVYHRTFLESRNLEWWWTAGVRGHDLMTVRQMAAPGGDGSELAQVPFYQNWYVHTQLRIITMRIFVGWENVAMRRDLQHYPGRLLPITRAVYGIRWTLWN